jgi:DNA-binding NtrC family response regulator
VAPHLQTIPRKMSQRALVVEPDAPIARLITEVLRRECGFSVDRVMSIPEAIAALHQATFAALVVDISQSAEALDQLTQLTKAQEAAVIVLTTGRIDRNALELFVSDHVYAVLPKPFEVGDLATMLREAVAFAKQGAPISSKLHGFLTSRLTQLKP